jgi:hypothetical protein
MVICDNIYIYVSILSYGLLSSLRHSRGSPSPSNPSTCGTRSGEALPAQVRWGLGVSKCWSIVQNLARALATLLQNRALPAFQNQICDRQYWTAISPLHGQFLKQVLAHAASNALWMRQYSGLQGYSGYGAKLHVINNLKYHGWTTG